MRTRIDVQALVLMYLAAGCDKPAPSPTAPMSETKETAPLASSTASVEPLPAASEASPPKPVASEAPPPAGAVANKGKKCQHDSDCGGLYCQRVFTGAGFTNDPGTCVEKKPVYRGRPLDVGAGAALAERDPAKAPWHRVSGAPLGAGSPGELAPAQARHRVSDVSLGERISVERARWASRLVDGAFEEHASVAAFARTICELVARGAPSWLVAATSRALADEVRHAEASFAWAERLGGERASPGRLPSAMAPFRDGEAFVRDVVRGGCIGETLAAEEALRSAGEAGEVDGSLGAFFETMADDEARHAALAFDTVRWLCEEVPSLRRAVRAEVASFRASASVAERDLLEPLLALL